MSRLSSVVLLSWVFVAAAPAAIVYSTGFEPPKFTTGNLDGQDGWNGHTDAVPSAAKVQTGVFHSGTQAVKIDPALIYDSAWYQKDVSFDPVALHTPIVTVEWWMRLDGAQESGTYWGLDVYGTDDQRLGRLQVNSSNKVRFNGVTTSTTITRGVWYDYKLIFDYNTNKYEGFVNGVSVAAPAAMPHHHGFKDADLTRWGSTLDKCTDLAYFDDYSITTTTEVPEPASLTLLGLCALALRRRA